MGRQLALSNRLVALVVFGGLAACGRIDFDARTDASTCTKTETWNRRTEWVDGTVDTSSVGNPASDREGRALWYYEVTHDGDPLGGAAPWYSQPYSLMVWDAAWFTSGIGAWAYGDDLNPPASQDGFTHTIRGMPFADTPRVRWAYPFSDVRELVISGTPYLLWDGDGSTNATPIDVEIAIVRYSPTLAATELVWSDTFSKPTTSPNDEIRLLPPLDVRTTILPGESIGFTIRAQMASTLNSWMHFGDNLTLSVTGPCEP